MLTKKEVAERLGVSESTVYRLAKTRRIGVYYVMGSTMRFSEADVEAYLESIKQEAIRYVPAVPASSARPSPRSRPQLQRSASEALGARASEWKKYRSTIRE